MQCPVCQNELSKTDAKSFRGHKYHKSPQANRRLSCWQFAKDLYEVRKAK